MMVLIHKKNPVVANLFAQSRRCRQTQSLPVWDYL